MFCPNCGNQIADNAKFCPKCGSTIAYTAGNTSTASGQSSGSTSRATSPVTPATAHRADSRNSQKKKKGRKKWIALIILLVIAAIVIGGAAVWLRSPVRQVQDDLNNGNYTEALVTYNDSVTDNFLWRMLAASTVSGYIDQLQEDYLDGSRTYDETVQLLGVLRQFDNETITGAVDTALEETGIAYVSQTQENYENGSFSYDEAIQILNMLQGSGNEAITGAADTAVEEIGTAYVDQVQAGYEDGSLSYSEAVQILSVLQQSDDETVSTAAETLLNEIETVQASADLFTEAEELYAEGSYVDAMELYAEITVDSAEYEAAQNRLEECEELYIADILERTTSLSTQREYKSAVNMVKIALEVFPEDEELLARYSELTDAYYALVKSDGMTAANDAIAEGDYISAIEAIDDALAVLDSDEDLSALRSSTVSTYESEISEQVAAYVEANDYDSALSLLKEATKALPESTVLSELYSTTEDNQPVKLADLTLSESDSDYEIVTGQVVTTDTIGNTYSSGNLYKFGTYYSGSEPYVKYYLGGKYTTLVFTLAVSVENETWLSESTLTIYGNNDEILYTSGELSRTSVPVEVTVDVTGTEWLYIKTVQSSHGVTLIVSNPVLYT